MQVVLEHLHHARLLLEAQQPVVHEAAVQAVADRAVHERRGDGAVHAARERADDVRIRTHRLLHDGDLLVQHVLHGPARGEAGDVEQEALDGLEPALAVRHLGVVLQAEQLARRVLDGHHRAGVALTDAREALGKPRGFVAVRHPHLLRGSRLALEQQRVVHRVHGHAAVLRLVRRLDLAAQALHEELHAVADAQHGDGTRLAVVEEALGDGGRALDVHGVGAAGEDDHARILVCDAFLWPRVW